MLFSFIYISWSIILRNHVTKVSIQHTVKLVSLTVSLLFLLGERISENIPVEISGPPILGGISGPPILGTPILGGIAELFLYIQEKMRDGSKHDYRSDICIMIIGPIWDLRKNSVRKISNAWGRISGPAILLWSRVCTETSTNNFWHPPPPHPSPLSLTSSRGCWENVNNY